MSITQKHPIYQILVYDFSVAFLEIVYRDSTNLSGFFTNTEEIKLVCLQGLALRGSNYCFSTKTEPFQRNKRFQAQLVDFGNASLH